MHFYESSIITTKDGLHCQVYGNEHPKQAILVKPKYIPTDKIESNALQYRFISSRRMNRLNLWAEKEDLKKYIQGFKIAYPSYVYNGQEVDHNRLFFAVPIDDIERIYFPRRGLKELMKMPEKDLDEHLKSVYHFVHFLLGSGLRIKDLGVTYSTLMGHYLSTISDINIVVYGKENFWKLMTFLTSAEHPNLRWKTKEEWLEFLNRRNRNSFFNQQNFVRIMQRKKSEGFFNNTLFVIFAAEKEEEVWFKWGEERYISHGTASVEGTVTNNRSSVVRPGCYEIEKPRIVSCGSHLFAKLEVAKVRKIVFYSRDYCMLANPGERIRACGVLEEVLPTKGENYYRLVVGYFDSYVDERREQEHITILTK